MILKHQVFSGFYTLSKAIIILLTTSLFVFDFVFIKVVKSQFVQIYIMWLYEVKVVSRKWTVIIEHKHQLNKLEMLL